MIGNKEKKTSPVISLNYRQDPLLNFSCLAAACCEAGTSRTLHFGDKHQFSFDSNEFSMTITGDENYYLHPSYTGFPSKSRNIFGEASSKNKNFALCLIHMPASISKTAEDFGCRDCVAQACMPQEAPSHGDACWISGWGNTENYIVPDDDTIPETS